MFNGEWSRSRYWLCYFLHNRHERTDIHWQSQTPSSASFESALSRWLGQSAQPATQLHQRRWLVGRAVNSLQSDPAYVQSLRLLVKEEQYHRDLVDHCLQRLSAQRQGPGPIRKAGNYIWQTVRRTLGMRFELSVILLAQIITVALWRLVQGSPDIDSTIESASNQLLQDKRAHIDFHAERLTLEFVAFNFIRRNLRRWRLRVMFALLLALVIWRQRRLIRAAGASRLQFAAHSWSSFEGLLEKMVPYRRTALVNALLRQRQYPYEKQQHML